MRKSTKYLAGAAMLIVIAASTATFIRAGLRAIVEAEG